MFLSKSKKYRPESHIPKAAKQGQRKRRALPAQSDLNSLVQPLRTSYSQSHIPKAAKQGQRKRRALPAQSACPAAASPGLRDLKGCASKSLPAGDQCILQALVAKFMFEQAVPRRAFVAERIAGYSQWARNTGFDWNLMLMQNKDNALAYHRVTALKTGQKLGSIRCELVKQHVDAKKKVA
eukprot:1148507-Pelagomonas_calceolata.AAC.2